MISLKEHLIKSNITKCSKDSINIKEFNEKLETTYKGITIVIKKDELKNINETCSVGVEESLYFIQELIDFITDRGIPKFDYAELYTTKINNLYRPAFCTYGLINKEKSSLHLFIVNYDTSGLWGLCVGRVGTTTLIKYKREGYKNRNKKIVELLTK